MRAKVRRASPETALMRILDALAREAIEASDEEVTQAAANLRMDLSNGSSAAFAGLTYFARPRLTDFFDLQVLKGLPTPAGRIAARPTAKPKKGQRRSKRPQTPTQRKPPGGQ